MGPHCNDWLAMPDTVECRAAAGHSSKSREVSADHGNYGQFDERAHAVSGPSGPFCLPNVVRICHLNSYDLRGAVVPRNAEDGLSFRGTGVGPLDKALLTAFSPLRLVPVPKLPASGAGSPGARSLWTLQP